MRVQATRYSYGQSSQDPRRVRTPRRDEREIYELDLADVFVRNHSRPLRKNLVLQIPPSVLITP